MLNKIDIKDICFNDFLHFTDKENIKSIAINGLVPSVGKNAVNIENSAKVFFVKGFKNVLKNHDVWLKWAMNRMFGSFALEKEEDYQTKINLWIKEYLSKEYLMDEEKKEKLFLKMYMEMKNRVFLHLDLEENIDYKMDDYDDVKLRFISDKDGIDYLFFKEMYGNDSMLNSIVMDEWNMHTLRNKVIEQEKISILVSDDNILSELDVLLYVYDNYKDKNYDLLDDFIKFVKKWRDKNDYKTKRNI